jgi:hypothetical protein
MITYKREEIKNKHGQYIAYWSKQKGNTEIEKFRNFRPDNIELVVTDRQGLDIICSVDKELGTDGHYLICFNDLGESIFQTEDCYGIDKDSIIDTLNDYDVI